MRSFDYSQLNHLYLPMETVRLLANIHEYRGKQELYREQAPQILETLKDVAMVQSTKSSNAIEGIVITDQRLKGLMRHKSTPLDRSEGEVAGYRDVLNLVHASYEAIPVTSNTILQLHKELYQYIPSEGGKWKSTDNVISETLPNGEKFIRFQPTPAWETPEVIKNLCDELQESLAKSVADPLLIISHFVLDFLSVHPFPDGNGRVARLLTLLLLYQEGFEVGRYISLEKVIEDTKSSYYETLYHSSQGWHENDHDIFPWVNYLLSTFLAAYKELESRVGMVQSGKGNKAMRVHNYIENKIGYFTKEDIRSACPDVSESTINRVLKELKEQGHIEATSLGRSAKWKKK
jgi:Fic family protein